MKTPFHKRIASLGGVHARSKRGDFVENWWGKRFLEAVQAVAAPARFVRGRTYARNGAVQSVALTPGVVYAHVRGSQQGPYTVRLIFQTVPEIKRLPLVEKIVGSPHLLALLLDNEMPLDLESVFLEEGLSLFPSQIEFRRCLCTCLDDSDFCKHMLAVLCLFAEVLDKNPFALLKLRGIPRADLIQSAFPQAHPAQEEGDDPSEMSGGADTYCEAFSEEAFDFRFYGDSESVATLDCDEEAFSGAESLPLPEYPFWRGSRSFQESMATFYDAAEEYTKKINKL